MQIQKVDPGRASFSDFSLDGAMLSISGITLDLEAEQQDQEVVIPFGSCNGMIHRGLMPCCDYVAEVIIPARRYQSIEVNGPSPSFGAGSETETTGSGKGKGKSNEAPQTHTEIVAVPLDLDSVTLKLWPVIVPEETVGEENNVE
jgi:hypothetical protein